jgi:hypothetical protein
MSIAPLRSSRPPASRRAEVMMRVPDGMGAVADAVDAHRSSV